MGLPTEGAIKAMVDGGIGAILGIAIIFLICLMGITASFVLPAWRRMSKEMERQTRILERMELNQITGYDLLTQRIGLTRQDIAALHGTPKRKRTGMLDEDE